MRDARGTIAAMPHGARYGCLCRNGNWDTVSGLNLIAPIIGPTEAPTPAIKGDSVKALARLEGSVISPMAAFMTPVEPEKQPQMHRDKIKPRNVVDVDIDSTLMADPRAPSRRTGLRPIESDRLLQKKMVAN